jgi:excisionase family DNA binding protein
MPQTIQVEPHGGLNPAERRIRPRFVSIREAAEYLGCSRSHFYAALLSKVKTVRCGRRNLVDLESLDELADSLLAAE